MGQVIKTLLFLFFFMWTVLGGWFTPRPQAQPLGMMSQQPMEISQYEHLACPGGRFVFGQVSDSGKDQFMLDTRTGRLWRIAESGEVGIYLRAVPYRTEKGEYLPLPEKIVLPKGEKPEKQ